MKYLLIGARGERSQSLQNELPIFYKVVTIDVNVGLDIPTFQPLFEEYTNVGWIAYHNAEETIDDGVMDWDKVYRQEFKLD